jgi:hypothetical protein
MIIVGNQSYICSFGSRIGRRYLHKGKHMTRERGKTIAIVVLTLLWLGSLGASAPEIQTVEKEVEKIVEVEVEKEVFKTPEACAEVIQLDSATYSRVGDFFGSLNVDGSYIDFAESFESESEKLLDYILPLTDTRAELIDKCLTNE